MDVQKRDALALSRVYVVSDVRLYREGLSGGREPVVADAPLTSRERQIAALVASGLPNKEIARRLRLGHATIKNHVHNILQKLNLQRRGEIAPLLTRNTGVEQQSC